MAQCRGGGSSAGRAAPFEASLGTLAFLALNAGAIPVLLYLRTQLGVWFIVGGGSGRGTGSLEAEVQARDPHGVLAQHEAASRAYAMRLFWWIQVMIGATVVSKVIMSMALAWRLACCELRRLLPQQGLVRPSTCESASSVHLCCDQHEPLASSVGMQKTPLIARVLPFLLAFKLLWLLCGGVLLLNTIPMPPIATKPLWSGRQDGAGRTPEFTAVERLVLIRGRADSADAPTAPLSSPFIERSRQCWWACVLLSSLSLGIFLATPALAQPWDYPLDFWGFQGPAEGGWRPSRTGSSAAAAAAANGLEPAPPLESEPTRQLQADETRVAPRSTSDPEGDSDWRILDLYLGYGGTFSPRNESVQHLGLVRLSDDPPNYDAATTPEHPSCAALPVASSESSSAALVVPAAAGPPSGSPAPPSAPSRKLDSPLQRTPASTSCGEVCECVKQDEPQPSNDQFPSRDSPGAGATANLYWLGRVSAGDLPGSLENVPTKPPAAVVNSPEFIAECAAALNCWPEHLLAVMFAAMFLQLPNPTGGDADMNEPPRRCGVNRYDMAELPRFNFLELVRAAAATPTAPSNRVDIPDVAALTDLERSKNETPSRRPTPAQRDAVCLPLSDPDSLEPGDGGSSSELIRLLTAETICAQTAAPPTGPWLFLSSFPMVRRALLCIAFVGIFILDCISIPAMWRAVLQATCRPLGWSQNSVLDVITFNVVYSVLQPFHNFWDSIKSWVPRVCRSPTLHNYPDAYKTGRLRRFLTAAETEARRQYFLTAIGGALARQLPNRQLGHAVNEEDVWDLEPQFHCDYRDSTLLPQLTTCACPICLAPFEPVDSILALPCTSMHFFHAECIRRWFQHQNNTCPLCRSNVTNIIRQERRRFFAIKNLIYARTATAEKHQNSGVQQSVAPGALQLPPRTAVTVAKPVRTPCPFRSLLGVSATR